MPVAPSEISLTINGKNKDYDLASGETINVLKSPSLTSLSVELLLPSTRYGWAKYEGSFRSPAYYLDNFEKLISSRKPFQFVVIRMQGRRRLWSTDIKMALEKYTIKDTVDQGTDVTVSLSLKQYRSYGTKIITFDTSGNLQTQSPARPSETETPSSISAQPLDTLWTIVKRMFGKVTDAALKHLSEKNDISSTETLEPGKEIKL